MVSALGNLLRLAAIAICLVTIASFGLYAINQTDSASAHQQESLATGGAIPAAGTPGSAVQTSETHTTGVRGGIDNVAKALTSPFDGVTSSSNSEWVKRGVGVLIALVVYGFGLGLIARYVRVRA
jgi:hypothetical protein